MIFFPGGGFPQRSQSVKKPQRTQRILKKLCVLRGLFFSVNSAGNKMREYFQKRFSIRMTGSGNVILSGAKNPGDDEQRFFTAFRMTGRKNQNDRERKSE
jgi:hypothetical protein